MRQYFSELEVGKPVAMSVILSSASARKTRAQKPYLVLEAFDGRSKITCNYWDWSGKSIPTINTVVYIITGQVTDYQGQKQITVNTINTDTITPVTDFMPSSGKDLGDVFKEAYTFATTYVQDGLLRDIALTALDEYRELWLTIPAATGVHHAFVGGTLIHSLSVAKIAYSMALNIPEAHADLCLVGGMLHDIGKLYAYGIEGASMCMTDDGKLFEHAHLGSSLLASIIATNVTPKCEMDCLKLNILHHIVLSHHGSLEHGAVVEPQCIEAHIVHLADKADATAQMIKEASDKTESFWTDKIWALNSRSMINYKHILGLDPMVLDDDELDIVGADGAATAQ